MHRCVAAADSPCRFGGDDVQTIGADDGTWIDLRPLQRLDRRRNLPDRRTSDEQALSLVIGQRRQPLMIGHFSTGQARTTVLNDVAKSLLSLRSTIPRSA